MMSKFWQPGLDSNTESGRRVRNAEIFGSNGARKTSHYVSAPANSIGADHQSPIRTGKMRGQISGPNANMGSFTARGSLQKLKKISKPKNGKKKLVGLGQGNRICLLTFDRKPSKVLSVNMDPKERVQTLIRIYEKFSRNRRGKWNYWDVVKHVKEMYREYLTPVLNQSRFGSIPGIEVGDSFSSRAVLALVGLHGQSQAGIDYVEYTDPKDGRPMLVAVSVVVSGVYEDDCDEGEQLMYTGEGGNDLTGSRKQIKDQKLEGGNLALVHSYMLQFPVRVIRARPSDLNSASPTVYSYDGLYKIESWRCEDGISNFKVFKYLMIREPNQRPLKWFGG